MLTDFENSFKADYKICNETMAKKSHQTQMLLLDYLVKYRTSQFMFEVVTVFF